MMSFGVSVPVYVCVCNALNDNALKSAAQGDVHSVSEVFRKCDARPRCGKCLHDVAELVEKVRADENAQRVAAE